MPLPYTPHLLSVAMRRNPNASTATCPDHPYSGLYFHSRSVILSTALSSAFRRLSLFLFRLCPTFWLSVHQLRRVYCASTFLWPRLRRNQPRQTFPT